MDRPMRRARVSALCLALAAITANCNLAGNSDPEIQFSSTRTDWSPTLAAFASSSGGPQTLLVTGLMITPNECFSLRAGLQNKSGVITVTITARQASNSPDCGANQGAYNYQFLTAPIESGGYTVRVVHAISGGASTVILETDVAIS